MPFAVVYDACILYPAALRDLLIRIGRTGVVQARWSEQILDECISAIRRERVDIAPERLERTRELMARALPGAMIGDFAGLIEGLRLPDPDRVMKKSGAFCLACAEDSSMLAPLQTERVDARSRSTADHDVQ